MYVPEKYRMTDNEILLFAACVERDMEEYGRPVTVIEVMYDIIGALVSSDNTRIAESYIHLFCK